MTRVLVIVVATWWAWGLATGQPTPLRVALHALHTVAADLATPRVVRP
jgi:hypothetical protein